MLCVMKGRIMSLGQPPGKMSVGHSANELYFSHFMIYIGDESYYDSMFTCTCTWCAMGDFAERGNKQPGCCHLAYRYLFETMAPANRFTRRNTTNRTQSRDSEVEMVQNNGKHEKQENNLGDSMTLFESIDETAEMTVSRQPSASKFEYEHYNEELDDRSGRGRRRSMGKRFSLVRGISKRNLRLVLCNVMVV